MGRSPAFLASANINCPNQYAPVTRRMFTVSPCCFVLSVPSCELGKNVSAAADSEAFVVLKIHLLVAFKISLGLAGGVEPHQRRRCGDLLFPVALEPPFLGGQHFGLPRVAVAKLLACDRLEAGQR